MTLRFSKKEIMILVASFLVMALFILGGYFLYLQPKKEDISNKETQLKSEKQLLAALQSKVAGTSTPSAESVAVLQKKVPVKQQLEQLILDLEKAEVISGSFISNMSFAEADVVAEVQEDPAAQQQTTQQSTEQTQQTEANKTTEEEQKKPAIPLPEGIKKLTVTLSVESPSYYELIKFIETLESLNRLLVVESVSFSGGNELTSLEAELEPLAYSLTFSAFYMPTLEDLQNQLPELDTPAPSNKTNPFSSAPELPAEAETE